MAERERERKKELEQAISQQALDQMTRLSPLPEGGPQPGRELCATRGLSWISWKDPDSVKVGAVTRLGRQGLRVNDQITDVHTYVVYVNAKNSFGGYVGERRYTCHVDPTEQRIVDFHADS